MPDLGFYRSVQLYITVAGSCTLDRGGRNYFEPQIPRWPQS